MFITGSISNIIKQTISLQSDFVVQKISAGKVVDTHTSLVDQFLSINGISGVNQRVYGLHYYEPTEEYFTIVGVDFYDEQIANNLKKLIKDIDIDKFLSKQNMIMGEGVKKLFEYYQYEEYYNFRPPNRTIEKVYFYDYFPINTNIVSSDMIIMEINLAKKILGIDDDYCTDIIFNVPNTDEQDTVKTKIKVDHFDTRVIQKKDLEKIYTNFFNYKSTIFMILYTIVLITFILIIYQRYTTITSVEKKEVGIYRSLGWSIGSIIKFKILENMIIFISAFLFGINMAYIYVYIFNAPIIKGLFIGFKNLESNIVLVPTFDLGVLSLIFLFFIVPIIAAILIPVWRISIIEPYEALR
ncbi:MAG: FtsX-like permease family protein [Campylobacterota bacterium]|nr:FtsX-like permease family protein [Campylobacterota bacterium]